MAGYIITFYDNPSADELTTDIKFNFKQYVCTSTMYSQGFDFEICRRALNCSSAVQWRHQGGMRKNFPPPQSEALPPLAPPVRRKKWPKSAIFGICFHFCPLRNAFHPFNAPPKKQFLVPPLLFWSSHEEW